jgi:uncharacterized protein YbaA (DUF1428 family)
MKSKKEAKTKASYIDGFVLPVQKNKLTAYRNLARKASKIWIEHGALEYYEAVGDDMKSEMGIPFPKLANTKADETVIFAWIVYKSKAHRNQVNKKVMSDKRLTGINPEDMPFDCKNITYGGFKILVSAKK